MASTPYDVLDDSNLSGINSIFDSIIIGINSGSVSVKDVSKSKESINEIRNTLPSLINTKAKFETKKQELSTNLENFDLTSLQNAENELKREEVNVADISLKLQSFEDENLELTNSLPAILHEIETNLKDVTSISYAISLDNS